MQQQWWSQPKPKTTLTEPENNKEQYDPDSSDSILDSSSGSECLSKENEIIKVKLSNTKYATNFQSQFITMKQYLYRHYHLLNVESMFWQTGP